VEPVAFVDKQNIALIKICEDCSEKTEKKYFCRSCNREVKEKCQLHDRGDNFKETKAVEVGNIFTLGTRFSEALDLTYQTEKGDKKPVFMGSYGIGPARLMGTVVEALADDKGIIWPESIAPFKVHLLSLGEDENVKKQCISHCSFAYFDFYAINIGNGVHP